MALPIPGNYDSKQGNGKQGNPKNYEKWVKEQKGKQKGKGKSNVYDLFGDDRTKFANEPLLNSPNSASNNKGASF